MAAEPFPAEWLVVLERDVSFYLRLGEDERERLRFLVGRFIAEKRFWGAEGLAVTDEMKVIVAAHAGLLVLNRPDLGLYPRNQEVIFYPGDFGRDAPLIDPDGVVHEEDDFLAGEAHHRGPIVLSWDAIRPTRRRTRALTYKRRSPRSAQRETQGYVILHEFAHALDSLGEGAPPLDSKPLRQEWARVFSREFETLRQAERRGLWTVLDPYGAENPAEFFAVATETFFLDPRPLLRRHPDLYRLLTEFYRQDPAAWPPPRPHRPPPPNDADS